MRNTHRWIVALLGLGVLAGPSGVFAQDWCQWRGANRDGKAAGFTAPDKWPTELTQAWKTTVGSGDATPALVGDKLYVFTREGDNEVMRCLNAADGKEVWQDKYATPAIPPPSNRHPGPRSSPAVADGKVVGLGVNGILSCWDAATGKQVWRKDLFPGAVPQFFTASSPMIVDGMVVAVLGGPSKGGVVALDLATGEPKWQWTGEGANYGSPVLMTAGDTKQVVTLVDKSLVGIGLADGKLLWQIPYVPQRMSYNATTPVVDGATLYVSGAGQGLKAITIEKNGDAFAAKEVWTNGNCALGFSSPVLKDGFLYGMTQRGFLFCVNAKTGETAWTDTTPRGGRGGFGPLVEAGGAVVLQASTGDLVVFKASEKGYEELAKIKVGGESYSTPVLSGKRVFTKDADSVTEFTLP